MSATAVTPAGNETVRAPVAGAVSTAALEAAIREIDERIRDGAPPVPLYIDQGQFFELLGRKDQAVQAYVNVLRIEPANVDALNALGLLTLATGNRSGARTLLSGAVLHGPHNATAHANLAYLNVLDDHLHGARELYEHALKLDPALAIAHHGLAQLLDRLGDGDGAARHRSAGLRLRPITIERFAGTGRPVYVLALGTEVQGNIPTYGYFDNRVFLLASLTVEHADASIPLPPHDLVFNAIGEADLCPDQLAKAAAIAARSDAPVINAPAAVAATSRVANAARLRTLPGVVTARMAALARDVLTGAGAGAALAEHGLTFPLLVRSPGYHTGDHFVKVDTAHEVTAAIAELPGSELLCIEYLDVADNAGNFRKYRTIIVDGKLYPLHLAISRRWKVHYFSADMTEQSANRREDAAFLTDMPGVLGERVMATLERIRGLLALDYGGIDFTIGADGEVIVFEANASMVVPLPGREAIWDYRRAPVAAIRAAVRRMIVERAGAHAARPA